MRIDKLRVGNKEDMVRVSINWLQIIPSQQLIHSGIVDSYAPIFPIAPIDTERCFARKRIVLPTEGRRSKAK